MPKRVVGYLYKTIKFVHARIGTIGVHHWSPALQLPQRTCAATLHDTRG